MHYQFQDQEEPVGSISINPPILLERGISLFVVSPCDTPDWGLELEVKKKRGLPS